MSVGALIGAVSGGGAAPIASSSGGANTSIDLNLGGLVGGGFDYVPPPGNVGLSGYNQAGAVNLPGVPAIAQGVSVEKMVLFGAFALAAVAIVKKVI